MTVTQIVVGLIAFLVAPVIGAFLAGLDRKISASMQGRVGPSVWQAYYDFRKLLAKDRSVANVTQTVYVAMYLFSVMVSFYIFFAGGNFLLSAFVLTMGSMFFILAGYSTRSPFAEIGAEREGIQVMSYEPMIVLIAVAMYLFTGSFNVSELFGVNGLPMVVYMPLVFAGVLFILTIKLRKSPFDISMSHHAHQEIVRGITTEMTGSDLAMVELAHWFETVMFLGWVGMFFINGAPLSILWAVIAALVVWLLEIFIDNNFARVKWQAMLKSSWIVALAVGVANLSIYLNFI